MDVQCSNLLHLLLQILYSRIAIALWKSSRGLERHIAMQNTTQLNYGNSSALSRANSKYEPAKRGLGASESQVGVIVLGYVTRNY